MHNLQIWFMVHSPHLGRSMTFVVACGLVLLVSAAIVLERQRPARRVARARHPETIPTWGDMYLDSLAASHQKAHRLHRGRIGST